jgi:hypothetical protein
MVLAISAFSVPLLVVTLPALAYASRALYRAVFPLDRTASEGT